MSDECSRESDSACAVFVHERTEEEKDERETESAGEGVAWLRVWKRVSGTLRCLSLCGCLVHTPVSGDQSSAQREALDASACAQPSHAIQHCSTESEHSASAMRDWRCLCAQSIQSVHARESEGGAVCDVWLAMRV